MSDINEMKIVQAEHGLMHKQNTEDLKIHIKRTDLAEKRIEMLTAQDVELKIELMKEIEPIKTHVSYVNGIVKAVLVIGSLIAALHSMGILGKLF